MKKSVIDKPISITCVALIVAFVALVIVKPDATINAVNVIFDYATAIFGVPILWFVFIGLFVCLYLAFGKYGKIKLGDGKPEYSLFSYIAMMMCAALAATAVYYSFVEWSFYLAEPSFGLEPYSREAAEYALPYAFFHWGFAVQVVFVLLGVCMAYGFYVKKVPHLRVSAICGEMMGNYKYKKPLGKIIDALTILSIIGGVGVVSMGVGVPIITAAISKVFGVDASFAVNLIVLLIVGAVFTLTSFVGVKKGMKRLSDLTMYLAIGLMAFIFIFGPTGFILKNFTYSCGKMLSNYIDMSLFTDPIGNSGFPEANTIFLFTLAFNYAALMGIFIAKISKGRTIKAVVLSCLGGISVGTWIMFGINGSFGLHAELTGQFELSKAEDMQAGLMTLFETLPLGKVVLPIVFAVVTIGFLATSLDSASFAIAVAGSKSLDSNGNPNTAFCLIMCVVLVLIPMAFLFTGAPFSAIKTLCIVLSIPFLFVILGMLVGLFKWLKADQGKAEPPQIEQSKEN